MSEDKPLLISRTRAAQRLNCSPSTLIRAEKAGRLTPIRLSQFSLGRVHYRIDELDALMNPPRVYREKLKKRATPV